MVGGLEELNITALGIESRNDKPVRRRAKFPFTEDVGHRVKQNALTCAAANNGVSPPGTSPKGSRSAAP
jgi:hypothetical protein